MAGVRETVRQPHLCSRPGSPGAENIQTAGANPVSATARLGMLPRKLKRRNAAEQAEQACPVSNALRGNVDIQLNASLA